MANSDVVLDRLQKLRQEQQSLEQQLLVETHQEALGTIQGLEQNPEGLISSRPNSRAGGGSKSAFGLPRDPNTDQSSKKKSAAGEEDSGNKVSSRKAILGRYFDAMSENPDYAQRRQQKLATVQPFSFDLRENRRAKSTSRRRFEDENERRECEIQEMLSHQFKANPVPPSTFLHKYELMVQEWCARKESCRQTAQDRALRIQQESLPAKNYAESFQKRKEDTIAGRRAISAQKERDARFEKKFKAKDVPLDVKMPKWEELQQRDSDRGDRIRLRADQLMAMSSRPPRMEAAEEMRKGHEQMVQGTLVTSSRGSGVRAQSTDVARRQLQKTNPNFTFCPMVVTTVPDYEYLWAKDRVEAMRRKEAKPTTVPKEFGLHQSTAHGTKKVMTQLKRDEQELKETRWPYMSKRAKVKPTPIPRGEEVVPPRGTHAQELKAEFAFKRIVSESETANTEAKAREERRKKQKDINKRMAPFFERQKKEHLDKNPPLEELVKQKKAALRRSDAEAKQRLKELEAKVREEPPLFMEPAHLDNVAKARAATEEQVLTMLKEHGLAEKTLTAIMTTADVSAVDLAPGAGAPPPTANATTGDVSTTRVEEPSVVEPTNKVNQVNNAPAVPTSPARKPVSSSSSSSSSGSSSSSDTYSFDSSSSDEE